MHTQASAQVKPQAGTNKTAAKSRTDSAGDARGRGAESASARAALMPTRELRRACPCGGGCPACASARGGEVLRAATREGAEGKGDDSMRLVGEVLRSPGRPLDASARALMESRFGHDFGHVRVHADGRAARAARSIEARAFTVGRHVVFGEGRYTTSDERGRFTLAHELAHVVQQGETDDAVPSALRIQPESDPREREADRVASHVARASADASRAATTTTTPLPVSRGWRSSLARLPRGSVQRLPCQETNHATSPAHVLIELWYKAEYFNSHRLLREFELPGGAQESQGTGYVDLVSPMRREMWEIINENEHAEDIALVHDQSIVPGRQGDLNNYLRAANAACLGRSPWTAGTTLTREEVIPAPPARPLYRVRPVASGFLQYYREEPEPVRVTQEIRSLERRLRAMGQWIPRPALDPPLNLREADDTSPASAPPRYQGYATPGHGAEESGVRSDATPGHEVGAQASFRPTLAPELEAMVEAITPYLDEAVPYVLAAVAVIVVAKVSPPAGAALLRLLRTMGIGALRALAAMPREQLIATMMQMALGGAAPALAR